MKILKSKFYDNYKVKNYNMMKYYNDNYQIF